VKKLICTTFVCTSFFLFGAEQSDRRTSQPSSPRRNYFVADKEDLSKMPQLPGARSRHQQLGDTGADRTLSPRDPGTYIPDVVKRRPSAGSERKFDFNKEENFRPDWKPANKSLQDPKS
jgi:hypothetical protein